MSDTLVIRLSELYEQVAETVDAAVPILTDTVALAKVEEICHNIRNRGVIRFLMSCLVAKIDNSAVDVRKPYTNIGGGDAFSGRHYDEHPVQALITKYNLPTNPTEAQRIARLFELYQQLTAPLLPINKPKPHKKTTKL